MNTPNNSEMIIRVVKVNRHCTPEEMLNTTGRQQEIDAEVITTMPCGRGEETEIVFFAVDRFVDPGDLEKEYEVCGLTPADPYSLAAVNRADPAFADERSNATMWRDPRGNWCGIEFYRYDDDGQYPVEFPRRVSVRRLVGCGWIGARGVLFAGIRK